MCVGPLIVKYLLGGPHKWLLNRSNCGAISCKIGIIKTDETINFTMWFSESHCRAYFLLAHRIQQPIPYTMNPDFHKFLTDWNKFLSYCLLICNVLSFFGSKIILDYPNPFGGVPIIMDRPNSFWLGPNHFEKIQIIKFGPISLIWTLPQLFGLTQNNLDCPK